ncbi:MAG: rod shape-determining protein RodA [gamma proteobacterium symbiont of Ctena orbiculata]|nr:MAG: rod shape-determining protein RodA [gamma proteobacterium symbiont of Ctena orbiculata]PVV24287.1 MAG: rod shape-determining protein RodA [gamma proteobacterium symbiont of Ctena orbiculata]
MSSRCKKLLFTMLCMLCFVPQINAGTPAPDGAKLYIISPMNGESISGPVTVRFGLRGMGVAPAGIDREKTGHHHLLIDVAEMPAMDKPLPSDENHRHFGGGQTEVTLDLDKGSHTLQLVLGDKDHIPFDPPIVSDKITITVK